MRKRSQRAGRTPAQSQVNLWLIGTTVISLLLAGSGWYEALKEDLRPQFHVVATEALPGQVLVKVVGFPDMQWHPLPFSLAVRLKITNLGALPAEILSYSLDVQTEGGWSTLRRETLHPPYVVEWNYPESEGHSYYDFSRDYLDTKLQTAIDPGRSVEGFSFLLGRGGRNLISKAQKLRITLMDTGGRRTRVNVDPPTPETKFEVLGGRWIPTSVPTSPWHDGLVLRVRETATPESKP